jgi:sodium-dependent dicarboxylate transporter 2/3/5
LKADEAVKAGATLLAASIFLWISITSQIQGQILGVVFLALVVWSLYPERHLESSMLIIVLLSFFQASLDIEEFIGSLFTTYGSSGLWIIVSGFVLAKAMEVSGLGRRIALWMATSLGGKPGRIVLSVAVANLALAPLSPSTTAKAFLLLPICLGLVEAFEVEKGMSRFGAAVMLMAMAANNVCSTAFLTATVPNPISAQYLKESAGLEIGWLGWLGMALPLSLLLLAASWFVCIRMFKPDVAESSESLERIRNLRDGLGPLGRNEKIVAAFFAIALLLWITDGMHPWNSGIVSLALSLVLFLPSVGVIKVGGFAGEVPWGSITLFAASMFLAKAVGRWGALDPVALKVFDVLNLSGADPVFFVVSVVLISMFLHLFFTSTTVYATVMVPLAISLAQLQGLGPQTVGLPVAFLAPVAVILPVNTIPNIVFHSAGYFNQKQMIAYGLVVSLVSTILVLLVGLPYWRLTGLI